VDLSTFCAQHLGDYKIPESWSLSVAPILRNANGKLAKKELRALAAQA
jgi:O-succinylbenzoic acid--CoA ligase